MRMIFLLLLLPLPLGAQDLTVPCETPVKTLRLLEAVPPLRDATIPYEQRVGALRALAKQYPDDFFIQRYYQDSFRRESYLADEFDRALAMYRNRPSDPLSRYYEARLLMYADPQRSRATFDELLRATPNFVWPHLEFAEWSTLPGHRSTDEAAPHWKAFAANCHEGLAPDRVQDPQSTRRALERRNTWIDLDSWLQLWAAEERTGVAAETLQSDVRGDLHRIEAWPFRPEPELFQVYREAERILNDPGLLESLGRKVEREAPNSQLALLLTQVNWSQKNPTPTSDAGPDAWEVYQDKEAKAHQQWLARWPNAWSLLMDLLRAVDSRARIHEEGVGSAEDLGLVDQFMCANQSSPDGGAMWPPPETLIARIYVAGKVRLDQVPALLKAASQNIEKQEKYRLSELLLPEELRAKGTDWRERTWQQIEEIRADYFLATDRPADARALIEQTLAKMSGEHPASSKEQHRMQNAQTEWLQRLGTVDVREGRVEEALAHYQASLAGWQKESLGKPDAQAMLAPIKQYYLAHGGTEQKWPEWATVKANGGEIPNGRTPPAFVKALPEFTAKDLSGRTWQLRDLTGKGTFVNLWATWCGPCRGEHPDIQKLQEMLKDRKDVQVLTISVDDSPGVVTTYLKQTSYVFPVICAPELADKLFPWVGLPTSFLVNAKGLRTSLYGFGGDAASLQQVLEDLKKAASEHQ
jgi:thiol-disulfide isomerase/thioredoxin